jgi:D-glycero-D-manno-heptose 1,7-bisphosphate phosphatase
MADAPCPRSMIGPGESPAIAGAAALFLDRDGVINRDHGYVYRREDFEPMPGIFDLARAATRLAMPVVVVTNQAGIARAYYDEGAFATLTRWMCDRFEAEGASITRVYYCPHHPDGRIDSYRLVCDCRKPGPGMFLAAARDLQLDLASSVLVGDKASDMMAGARAGVGTLALTGNDVVGSEAGVVHRLHDLRAAIGLLPARAA